MAEEQLSDLERQERFGAWLRSQPKRAETIRETWQRRQPSQEMFDTLRGRGVWRIIPRTPLPEIGLQQVVEMTAVRPPVYNYRLMMVSADPRSPTLYAIYGSDSLDKPEWEMVQGPWPRDRCPYLV